STCSRTTPSGSIWSVATTPCSRCRAKRSTTSARRSPCSAATGGCGCSIPPSDACGSSTPERCATIRTSRRCSPGASRCSPLTNIIGFSHFLADPVTGPLTEKQHEYLGYIQVSTNALLAIINNILDLATIDAGAMKLNLGPVDIRATMEGAAEGVQDRLG